jgi:hypothetical protein
MRFVLLADISRLLQYIRLPITFIPLTFHSFLFNGVVKMEVSSSVYTKQFASRVLLERGEKVKVEMV